MDPSFNLPEQSNTKLSALRTALANTQVIIANNSVFNNQPAEAWLFRDDIGSPNGIKGYEEQVNSVGSHHGHCHWPSDITWNTWNSATLRRGFKVFQRTCQGCHGAMH
jgi:cytochrome c1